MLSDEVLNKLSDLFEQDQKDALEFQQGTRNMTVLKQLKYYFGNQYPFTNNEERFLDGFAINIQKNIGLIYKIAKLKDYSFKLSDKAGFTKVNLGITDTSIKSNKRSLNNSGDIKEYLKHGNNYSGSTERSDDWSGIKELYETQAKKTLQTDVRVLFRTVEEDDQRGGNITFKDVNSSINKHLMTDQTDNELDKRIAELSSEARELPSWNTISTGADSVKARNTSNTTREGAELANSNHKGTTSNLGFVDSENISKAIQADLHDLRSAFWNSFYYLFTDYPCR